jgi:hypothetical protein
MNRKDEILRTLSTSIRRARRRATEQPGVLRHEMYARSLSILYEELEELPEDHRLFEAVDRSLPRRRVPSSVNIHHAMGPRSRP